MVLQLLALAAVGVTGLAGGRWPVAARTSLFALGLVVASTGGLLGWAGIRALGPSLTALPHPADGAALRQGGIYGRARHPIYGALLLVCLGFAGITSPWALVSWTMLLAVLLAKSAREERWLEERYEGYASYRRRVRRRFVPFVA